MTREPARRFRSDGSHRPPRPVGFSSAARPRAGFSLVEIMMVVLIISVLAMLAVPGVAHLQRKANASVVVNDFRVFGSAFETYAQEMGQWPPECAAGVFPAGMDNRINKVQWLRTTPIGGQYNWEYSQLALGAPAPLQAAIAISATASAPLTFNLNQLTDLEQAIDGNNSLSMATVTTGTFRLGTGANPLFVIAP